MRSTLALALLLGVLVQASGRKLLQDELANLDVASEVSFAPGRHVVRDLRRTSEQASEGRLNRHTPPVNRPR